MSQARLYREIGEEDGLGDIREGEIRVKAPPGEVTVTWEDLGFPIRDGCLQAGFRKSFSVPGPGPEPGVCVITTPPWSPSRRAVRSG